MEASIVDLRYKMKNVLEALRRNETVKIFYRGKVKGIIIPSQPEIRPKKVEEHPFFGMRKDDQHSVSEKMDHLRGGRYKDIDDVV